MRKFLILILSISLVALVLCSCDKKDDVPEGLQLVTSSEEGGYKFYAPDGWMNVNTTGIAGAKVSSLNNTSITFTEAKMPVGTIPEYFNASLSEFSGKIKESMTITLRDEVCSFGNANGEAYKYIYTYKYEDYDFACMQILLTHDDSFYIFTYTSYGDVADETSTYRQYLDDVQLAIENFLFTEKSGKTDAPSYEKDGDGYNLVSDSALSGFKLYLPDEYEVIYSDAYVKARISDGANLSLSKATQTGIGIFDYLEHRKNDMSPFTTDFTDVKITVATEINTNSDTFADWSFDVMPEYDSSLKFGNLESAKIVSYEYKYSFNGKVYHVYQIMGVDRFSGYVLTYTALNGEYSEHIEKIKTILEKVEF